MTPADDEGGPLADRTQAIVYGSDDRLDVYEHPDAKLRELAKTSLVSLIPRVQFGHDGDGDVAIITRRLRDAFDVCEDQRFASQPTAAVCTGVLIDDDLVLTAGHCFEGDSCRRMAFVFDYFLSTEDTVERHDDGIEPISWADIYGCRRIVQRMVSPQVSLSRIDYAIVQLDRPALARTPVAIRTEPLAPGEPLATIGCASGLPAKIDSGSHVVDPRAAANDFFLLDSDTFEGSSGSGVFDAAGALVGVLVRGGSDYIAREGADCMVPKVIEPGSDAEVTDAAVVTPGAGEEATYVARAIEGLCAMQWPSPRLCGTTPRCGDGFCSASETRELCLADCGCTRSDCAALSSPPALAKTPVVQKARSQDEGAGCALSGDTRGNLPALLLSLAWLARAWRRPGSRKLLRSPARRRD